MQFDGQYADAINPLLGIFKNVLLSTLHIHLEDINNVHPLFIDNAVAVHASAGHYTFYLLTVTTPHLKAPVTRARLDDLNCIIGIPDCCLDGENIVVASGVFQQNLILRELGLYRNYFSLGEAIRIYQRS